MDFREILYSRVLRKPVEKIEICLKRGKTGNLPEDLLTFMTTSVIALPLLPSIIIDNNLPYLFMGVTCRIIKENRNLPL
jgi:hypothetical protein